MRTNDKKIYSSLLRHITPEQVQNLILEEELKLKGYKFHYIVDPYDLQKYCFPSGITQRSSDKDEFRKLLTDDDKLDEHIVYDTLFQDTEKFFYILDQHIDELYDFQIIVRDSAWLGLTLIETNEILINKFKNINFSKSLDFLSNIESSELSLIVAIAIGYIREGLKKIDKIKKEDKRLISEITDEIKDNSILEITKLIKETDPNGLSEKLMDHFIKIAFFQIRDKNKYKLQNKIIHFYNDSDVIDRVISVNNKLIDGNKKELCLFLSSTGSSFSFFQYPKRDNSNISYEYNEIHNHIKDELNEINGSLFNPHRTSSQLFLSFILNDEENKHNKIEFLKEFKESIAINFDINHKNLQKGFDSEIWKSRLTLFRERTENYGVLSQFAKYKQTIELAKEKRDVKNYKKLYNAFKSLLIEGKNSQEILSLRDENFRIFIYENSFKNSLDVGYRNLKNLLKENYVSINPFIKGKDRIQGKYHSLPLLFFLQDKEVIKTLEYYVDFVLNIKGQIFNAEIIFSFYKEWLQSTSKLVSIDNDDNRYEVNLLRCIILMLLPDIPNQFKLVNNRIKEILEFEINEDKDTEYLKKEFYYLISWSARRIQDYKTALKYTNKGIKYFPADARFYHGRALIKYSQYIDKNKNDKKELKTIVKDSYKAIELYKEIENRSKVDKLIISLYNTIVYIESLVWEIDFINNKVSDKIFEIRKLLDTEIKKDENYKHLLEFLHTEAYLELLESQYYLYNNDLKMAKYKIERSKNAISKALSLDNNEDCAILEGQILTAANNVYKALDDRGLS